MRSAKEERFAVCILKVVGIGGLSEWSVDGRYLCSTANRKDNECGQKNYVQIIFQHTLQCECEVFLTFFTSVHSMYPRRFREGFNYDPPCPPGTIRHRR